MIVDQKLAGEAFRRRGSDRATRCASRSRTPAAGAAPPAWRTVVGISRTVADLPEPGATPSSGHWRYTPYRQVPPTGAALLVGAGSTRAR